MVVVNSGLADGGITFSIDVMYAENLFPMTLNEGLNRIDNNKTLSVLKPY